MAKWQIREYKKRAEEKLQREKDLSAKAKKIDKLFSKSSVDVGSILTQLPCLSLQLTQSSTPEKNPDEVHGEEIGGIQVEPIGGKILNAPLIIRSLLRL